MCQGLPCIGAVVEILRDIDMNDVVVPEGTRGEVVAEHLDQREITVKFTFDDVQAIARVDEKLVRVVRRRGLDF